MGKQIKRRKSNQEKKQDSKICLCSCGIHGNSLMWRPSRLHVPFVSGIRGNSLIWRRSCGKKQHPQRQCAGGVSSVCVRVCNPEMQWPRGAGGLPGALLAPATSTNTPSAA
eukprot:6461907-Amphidinium_carterae.2